MAAGETFKVPARPAGVWTWALDFVEGPAWISVTVASDQRWFYTDSKSCGADGDLESLVGRGTSLLPSAPTGSLLVKVGGGTADLEAEFVRVAGSRALIALDSGRSGPLFLTMNDDPRGFSDNKGELSVEISITRK